MKRFECIVVGAGPAGSTALRRLAQLGVKACAVDKAAFPRYKPCGGAISALTSRELDFQWEDLIEASLHRVDLSFRHNEPLRCESDAPFAHFVMRDRFDHRLLEKAIEAGGQFIPEAGVTGIEPNDDGVIVRTNKGAFQADVVIGADGANGPTARAVGLFRSDRGIAVEAEIDAPSEVLARYQDRVYISYAEPPWGYGWVFPKKDRLSVGVGTFSHRRRAIKDAFEHFLQATQLDGLPMEVYGHPIPTGGDPRPIYTGRVVLTGDAAALNDPLSGEGIAHAVLSGKIAANHVVKAMEQGQFDFSDYQEEIQRRIVDELGRAASIAEKLYTFPRLFYWLFTKSPGTLELYFRLVRGELRYEDLSTELQRVFTKFSLFRSDRPRSKSTIARAKGSF